MSGQLIEGAVIAFAAVGIGFSLPSRRRRPNPKKAICGCTHHLALHDPETRECSSTVPVPIYDSTGEVRGYERKPCACRQYIGPPAA